MGRQAYLTRLALGRSAFEPSQSTTVSSEYIQLSPSQQDVPLAAQEPNRNQYVQLYDERGNPINPRAREHGRRFREAQNDVLASIGLLERRRPPTEDLPGAYEQRLEEIENEDSAGNAMALSATLTGNLCTWWIGSLRDRILTFQFRRAISFSQIVASEYQKSRRTLVYAGFTSRLFSAISVQTSLYLSHVLRPLDNLLFVTRASRKTRHTLQRYKNTIHRCFRLLVEVFFYPYAYYGNLQRLGLVEARPLLPSLKSFIPFSSASPIQMSPLLNFKAVTLVNCFEAIITSPLVFVCFEHFVERWIYAMIYEAIDTSIIHPEDPDLVSPDDGSKNKATAILGLHQKSPSMLRNAINKILVTLGWGAPFSESRINEQSTGSTQRARLNRGENIEVSGREISNLSPLQIPLVHEGVQPISGADGSSRTPLAPPQQHALSPASPTSPEATRGTDDPRIRITNREGIVEMEVRLPSHVLSFAELSGASLPRAAQEDGVVPTLIHELETAYHRVTQLSTEPAQMIGAICRAQIIGWVTLPLKMVTLRLVANHYLTHRPGIGVPLPISGDSFLRPVVGPQELNAQSVGVLMSRVALCGALGVAIDLTLWGCQWLAVTWVGEKFFSWGTL
ncbi:hypothetical protein CC78DRAFT_543159 [Lojkania enalia]|uniref:Uncharacterized protein n=1 Tax=Lojkania enalia TaxID=147567 RepID=A0A9P4KBI4_9PLEO|nr:hypothetical protein CC78DRAFT_543159 [Didymosphaeria enalia]